MIPDMSLLYYPMEDTNSLFANEIELQMTRWIDEYELPDSLSEKYKRSRFGDLTTRFFPHARREVLEAGALHMLVFFAFDDLYAGKQLDELRAACEEAIGYLEGYMSPRNRHVVVEQFGLLREYLLPMSSAEWMSRYIQHVRQYFDAMLTEAFLAGAAIYPSADYYKILRENLVGLYQLVDFVELEIGLILPPTLVAHPFTRKLRQLAVLIMSWCNDYYSALKEMKDGELMNLVLIICQEQGCTLEAAYDQVISLHNQQMDVFMRMCNNLPALFKQDEGYLRYVAHLQLMVGGHKTWTEHTFRYSSAF
ncbi:hypothetical protein KTO58_16980 [Chitinophaga pendula]|uniref:terpene synthase family protein n=1 Tax=Chitinophaga TaxID=79328 RepID=UPI000BAFD6A7|nr:MULTISPECIES: hypothetical protein [Chitinophaga]ASZ11606.1 hypothetical protein CK934_11865 [Chitinophaga sp. MD30]UCJ05384.1 hypothetical protein KTO58_16980 [Chitinophaga pendula]